MMDTLERLMDFYSRNDCNNKSKAIIWAHNTHIGDARFTDMAQEGMINIGQLVRQKKGIENVVIVGFSTYSGTVIAANQWGAKMEKMNVPPAKEGSWDSLLHNLNDDTQKDKIILFDKGHSSIMNNTIEETNSTSKDENYESIRGQRAIGVVYNPKYERFGNYVPTQLSKRYDVLIFVNNTNALSPLHLQIIKNKDLPETFPTGV